METIIYHTEHDKLKRWGDGPWVDEPDKVQWQDKATGLPCLARRGQFGGLCGYVGVSPGHPAYGKRYNDVYVDVHGGLTYAAKCSHGEEDKSICHIPGDGEPDDVWWLGFDCGHYMDFSPGLVPVDHPTLGLGKLSSFEKLEYRTLDFVQNECRRLAKQLSDPELRVSEEKGSDNV